MKAFRPFTTPEMALESINDISEGIVDDFLKQFLLQNIPKPKNVQLGVADGNLRTAMEAAVPGITCIKDARVLELLRGIRFHFNVFFKDANS